MISIRFGTALLLGLTFGNGEPAQYSTHSQDLTVTHSKASMLNEDEIDILVRRVERWFDGEKWRLVRVKKKAGKLREILRDAPETFNVSPPQLKVLVRFLDHNDPPSDFARACRAFHEGVTDWLFPNQVDRRQEKEFRGDSGRSPKDEGRQSPIMVKPKRKR
jgi:hypothetical protein